MSESFEFIVGGIEDGIIQVLTDKLKPSSENPSGYLKTVATYGGELDEQTLRKFVDELTPRFPLMLVAYGDGEDKEVPATSPVFGEPRIFRHDCSGVCSEVEEHAQVAIAQRHTFVLPPQFARAPVDLEIGEGINGTGR